MVFHIMNGEMNRESSSYNRSSPGSTKGFSFISVLIFIMVTGIALVSVNKSWIIIMKREKEKELIFRGDRFRHAIESYYKSGGKRYPRELKLLLKDDRYPVIKRHIRRLYKEPMAKNGDWKLIRDPSGGIKGVHSKSKDKPLKMAGFNQIYKNFENSKKYSEWLFVYAP